MHRPPVSPDAAPSTQTAGALTMYLTPASPVVVTPAMHWSLAASAGTTPRGSAALPVPGLRDWRSSPSPVVVMAQPL